MCETLFVESEKQHPTAPWQQLVAGAAGDTSDLREELVDGLRTVK